MVTPICFECDIRCSILTYCIFNQFCGHNPKLSSCSSGQSPLQIHTQVTGSLNHLQTNCVVQTHLFILCSQQWVHGDYIGSHQRFRGAQKPRAEQVTSLITINSPHKWKKTENDPIYPPTTVPLLSFLDQTQSWTHTLEHTRTHTHSWITDNWDCLCSTCAWKQLIFYEGVRNHPAATSSEKWSNLKALRTKCDIHDLDSSSSRAEPPCHNWADVTPIQTKGRGSEVKSGEGGSSSPVMVAGKEWKEVRERAKEYSGNWYDHYNSLQSSSNRSRSPLLIHPSVLRGKHAEKQWWHFSFSLQRQETIIATELHWLFLFSCHWNMFHHM